jgi:putative tryptophan/tyrosine transport system substrate-binding protein
MTRRLLIILTLGLLVAPLIAEAQPVGKVYRIGWLGADSPPTTPNPPPGTFWQTLHDLGYVEGQNLVIQYRYAAGREERLPDLAAELVRLPVDVIVADAAQATRAAQHATRTIPIVMRGTADPVAQGLVASLARPGGNTTGVSFMRQELIGKQLELLKELVPHSTRIAVLGNPASPGYILLRPHLLVAAQALGLHLHVVELRSAEELDTTFAAMAQAGVGALVVLADPLLINSLRRQIADLAVKSRLPTMTNWKYYADDGGLMSYGPHLRENDRLVAIYVDKILKGAKPADLPIEQPTKFELVINLKTAEALGLTIPPTLLFQADEVIR